MQLKELTCFLNRTLELEAFASDHSNNGLQVEGRPEIRKVVAGVDASLALFEAAAATEADLVLVHHGLSWGAEPRRFTGITARRLETLFRNGMSLYAVHLPLDAHALYGNNARLAALGRLTDLRRCCHYDGVDIGFLGNLPEAMKAADFAAIYEQALSCRAEVFAPSNRLLRSVSVVSGGGGSEALQDAAAHGCDALLTGEFTHTMYHAARELDLAVIALGHYASETVGVRALLRLLEEKFQLETEWIDLPTGL